MKKHKWLRADWKVNTQLSEQRKHRERSRSLQRYDALGVDKTLDVSLCCIEQGLQRRFSSSTKQMNITVFKLKTT
jgi:hypothetical protein